MPTSGLEGFQAGFRPFRKKAGTFFTVESPLGVLTRPPSPGTDATAPAQSDEELVARVLEGEVACFGQIMRRYNSRAFRTARAITRSDDEAEDVMQQAYVDAYANLAGFEHRARFSTWLLRIVVNEALSRRRRASRVELLSDLEPSAGEFDSMGTNPESSTADRSLLEAIERLIDAMPGHYRTVLVLRSVEGLSVGETAAALQISEETVRTRLHRARGLLQDRLSSSAERLTRKAFDFHLSRCDRIVAKTLQRLAAPPSVPSSPPTEQTS